jgi:hypothetical protein
MALVGEPTRVPRPPIDAAKAMPIASAPAKPSVWPGSTFAACSTASAMGIMIRVVAVLETIRLMVAVATMKASSIAAGLDPPRVTMAKARRRWRPVRSIARAMIAPPSTRNRIGE